jgi:hypothetical protein
MFNQKINFKIALLIIVMVAIFAGILCYYAAFPSAVVEKPKKAEPVSIPEQIFNFTGTIVAKEGNILSIEIFDLTKKYYDLVQHPKEIRKVEVGPDTRIVQPVVEPPKPGQTEPPEPTQPKEKSISLNDLNVGDQIAVWAKENIKYKKEFTATKIIYVSSPVSEDEEKDIIMGF